MTIPAITTNSVKAACPVFTIDCQDPQEVILMVGSCRSVPYLNYFKRINDMGIARLRVHFIEPWDQHWDSTGKEQDFAAALFRCEDDPRILKVLREATVFIHEHYGHCGMFNTLTTDQKNIFQFGLEPRLNITIPNFHDVFALFTEQLQFDAVKRERFQREGMTNELFDEMKSFGLGEIDRFVRVCGMSSFPTFGWQFLNEWTERRYFWRGNHVAMPFTLGIFEHVLNDFLNIKAPESFWDESRKEDLYANHPAPMTLYDQSAYGLTWDEPVVELKAP